MKKEDKYYRITRDRYDKELTSDFLKLILEVVRG